MKNFIIAAICISTMVLIQGLSSQPDRYEGKIVKDIIFKGLYIIEEEDLLEEMTTMVNEPLRSSNVRKDLHKLYRVGNFEKVDVEVEDFQEGVRIRFLCKERPIIRDIVFKGNDELSQQELKTTILVKEGDVYRKDLIERSVVRVKDKYNSEGLFNSSISYKVEPHKGNKSHLKVTFTIDEGEEILVQKIAIFGAKHIHPGELRSMMDTEEDGLFTKGKFEEDVYEKDKSKIVMYYRKKGFLDAQVVEDSVDYEWVNPEEKNERGIFVTIKVDEGEKYYFDGCTVTIKKQKGKKSVFTSEEIVEELGLTEKGSVFDFEYFMKDRQMISFKYATKGYIFARVIPKRTVNEREVVVRGKKQTRKFIKVDYIIEEGSQAYIDMIIVKGNKKTKDKVIRRELRVKEGELFDSRKMQLSRERVYNLGFFKEVNIDVRPGSREGYMNLVIDVEEQPTGTISLGGGYGTTSGFSIFADVSENNLFGNGQRVGAKFEYGPLRNAITLSFYERWLLDYPIGFTSSIFYYLYTRQTSSIFENTNESASYRKRSIGYSLGLHYRFFNYYTVGTRWTHAFTRLIEPSGNATDEVFEAASLGTQDKRSLGFFLIGDNRDNYMNPTRGVRAEFTMTMTGGFLLRGDDHYITYKPEITAYFTPFHIPFLRSHPVVLEFRASGTFITPPWNKTGVSRFQNPDDNPWIETEDRLVMGGPETIRGWDYLDRDFPESWYYVGLYHRILYGFELRIPIHPQMLWFAFFFDAGAMFSDRTWEAQLDPDLQQYLEDDRDSGQTMYIDEFWERRSKLLSYFRYSWGFGFRIQIPMMPLRFWFGRKMIYDGGFKAISDFTFQFAIGDMRF